MSGLQKNFRALYSAFQFITILKPFNSGNFSPTEMIRFFPVVGIGVGAMLIAVDAVASLFFIDSVSALADVIFLVVVTGALHIDGLGDTADGVFSHTSRERALAIMKDSRTGTMGLVAILGTLAVKFAGIYSVKISCSTASTMVMFLVIPSLSRGAMIFGIKYLPYGREQGTGYDFFTRDLYFKDFLWLWLPLVISLFAGIKCLTVHFAFIVLVFAVLMFFKKKMACITGDMLGAMTEIIEAALFVVAGAGG